MSRTPVKRFPREVYRRLQASRKAREESGFRPRLRCDPDAPELLLSPHLDDAVLDCWSLLAGERPLAVVNVFAGVPAPGRLTLWDAITGAQDSAERVRERIAEDATAIGHASRAPLNLALLDGQYGESPDGRRLCDLDDALVERVACASRVYAPAGIGGHPDHLFTRRYARMLHRSGLPVTLYADLPYCVLHGWPHWVDGRPSEPCRDVDPFWLSFLADVPEMPPLSSARVERLDLQSAGAKLEAMRCYRTQFPALSYGARDLLADPAIHGFEVRWELSRVEEADP